MDWKEVGGYIKKFAPALGAAVGGPAGAAVGGAVSMVAGAFGIKDPEPSPQMIMDAIKADPNAALKLQEMNNKHEEKFWEISLEGDRLELQDRQGARSREQAIVEATGKVDGNLYAIAWTVIAGFFIICAIMIFGEEATTNEKIVFLLLGTLTAGFTNVLNYFFGTTKSSGEKTKLLSLNK